MEKGTLSTLIRRAYIVCSNDNLLQEELHRIETRFTEFNGYLKCLVKQTLDSFENNNKTITTILITKTITIQF